MIIHFCVCAIVKYKVRLRVIESSQIYYDYLKIVTVIYLVVCFLQFYLYFTFTGKGCNYRNIFIIQRKK